MVEVFKSTSLRRMTTGGNYINVSADVVLASDYASLEAELKAAREALTNAAFAFRTYATSVEGHHATKYEVAKDLRIQADLIDAALSRPPVGERGWQPMESAPKDGTRVLLWAKEWTAACTGQYYGGDRGWGAFYDIGMYKYQPTHWMPLPAAPIPEGK